MVERPGNDLSVRRQCVLLSLTRSGVYRKGFAAARALQAYRRGGRSGRDARYRRTASRTSVLRLTANDLRTQQGRSWDQPQASAAADAGDGDRGAGSAPRHEQSRARAWTPARRAYREAWCRRRPKTCTTPDMSRLRKHRSFMGLNPTIFRQAHFASFLALQITQPYSRVADIADDYAPEAWVPHRHTDDHC